MESIFANCSKTHKAIITKFDQSITLIKCYINYYILGSKGAWPTSRDLHLNFGTPSISKERLKIETSNLVRGLMARRPIQKVAKLGQLGTGPRSRDLLLNFGTPSISKERLKIETSKLVCGLIARKPI